VELSFRLNENKNQLAMVPNSIIWHKVGGSVHKSNTKEGNLNPLVHFWNWRNRIWVMKKYQSPLLLILNSLFLIPQFLFTCLYFIARGRWIKLKLTFKGFIEGIRYSIN
jgi:GT2 family glycosyltransferase